MNNRDQHIKCNYMVGHSIIPGLFFLLFTLLLSPPGCKVSPKQDQLKGETGTPAGEAESGELAEPAVRFDLAEAESAYQYTTVEGHIKELSVKIGTRFAGSKNENAAAGFIEEQFKSYGYTTERQDFPLDDGTASCNVIAYKGKSMFEGDKPLIVIGGHYDSKKPASPGANDNASGVALVLHMAEIMEKYSLDFRIVWVAFGAEEIIDKNPDHHHYGSRRFVKVLLPENSRRIIAMASIDMIGFGPRFNIDNMGISSNWFRDILTEAAEERGYKVLHDVKQPWSDHEAFESAGIPVAYIHWRTDPNYHSANDVIKNVKPDKVKAVFETMIRGIGKIDDEIAQDPSLSIRDK